MNLFTDTLFIFVYVFVLLHFNIIKVDVDRNRDAAEHFQIQGVPTLILFKNGQVKWRQSGVVPANTLVQVINQYGN